MYDFHAYHDKAVAIYGAGPAGLSAYRALFEAGAHIFLWDPNEAIREKLKSAQITCTPPMDWPWQELQFLLPDVSARTDLNLSHEILKSAAEHEVPVYGELELFARALDQLPDAQRPKVIGITGTHGKSTTGAMLAHVLREAGRDVEHISEKQQSLFSLAPKTGRSIIILELTAKQLAFAKTLRCDVGVLLNLTGADVRFFGSAERSVKCATRIFRNQALEDALIIGTDDAICQKLCTALSSGIMPKVYGSETILPISGEATLGQGMFSLDGRVYDARFGKSVEIGDLSKVAALSGPHINQDLTAVYAAANHLGVTASQVTRGMQLWSGVAGRMSHVGEFGQVTVVDDSRSNTYRSVSGALKSTHNIIWVGGGRAAQGKYKKLKDVQFNILKAFVFGVAGDNMEQALSSTIDIEKAAGPESAIEQAFAFAEAYSQENPEEKITVLVSPGAAGTGSIALSDCLATQLRTRLEGVAA